MPINDVETRKASETDVDNAPEAAVETDADETKTTEAQAKSVKDAGEGDRPEPGRKSVSISLRGLVRAAAVAAVVIAIGALSWLYVDAKHQLSVQAARADNAAHAEKVALDYAVNAATMDFKDLQAWRVKLVAGTSPELSKKLSDAGTSMEQVLVPLQWSSTAQPLVAKVRSVNGGIYVVDSFVSVQTKTVQAPEALQSTATYSTTIDSNKNWQITDVGGIGSALGSK